MCRINAPYFSVSKYAKVYQIEEIEKQSVEIIKNIIETRIMSLTTLMTRLRFLQEETTLPKDLPIFRRITVITLTMM